MAIHTYEKQEFDSHALGYIVNASKGVKKHLADISNVNSFLLCL